jgi:2-polyprenyl-3-methyl-5-hydroxy-6-metoxy-1,4-benzoquinol methylase
MCVKAVLQLEDARGISFDRTTTKILDFGCCNGAIGDLLASEGFTEIYGQEGSKSKAKRVMERGVYKEVDSFLLGKQRISTGWRRDFDIVTCSDNLKMGLFPATCFTEMMRALKPGGILVFTITDKYLNEETDLGMGYRQKIDELIADKDVRLLSEVSFSKYKGIELDENMKMRVSQEFEARVFVFQTLV